MPKVGDAFPSKWLKASDLGDARVVVTIENVEFHEIGQDKKEKKPVLFFKGKSKGLVLNVTNARKIVKITGTEEMNDWHGWPIMLYTTEVEAFGEMTQALRVREAPQRDGRPVAPPPPPPPTPADDDEVPF
jgi:hypothetical protein